MQYEYKVSVVNATAVGGLLAEVTTLCAFVRRCLFIVWGVGSGECGGLLDGSGYCGVGCLFTRSRVLQGIATYTEW